MESLIIHGAIETEKLPDPSFNYAPFIDIARANLKIRDGGIDEKTDMYLHYICFYTCTCR